MELYHLTAHEIHDLLVKREVSAVEVPLMSKVRSAETFARGLVFGNPLYQEIVDRGGVPTVICAAVAKAISTQLGSQMPLKALVFCASNAA